jgi:hypothetical protein
VPIIEVNGVVYGMTQLGPNDAGIYYSIHTDGTNFTILDDFSGTFAAASGRLKSEGSVVTAYGSIAFADETIYGVVSLESGAQKKGSIKTYQVNQITAIENQGVARIEAYPNPTQDVIRIKGNKPNSQISIRNALGVSVSIRIIDENTIDVSQLPGGLYHLITNSGSIKFLKQ